jgi:hypothetical protein
MAFVDRCVGCGDLWIEQFVAQCAVPIACAISTSAFSDTHSSTRAESNARINIHCYWCRP